MESSTTTSPPAPPSNSPLSEREFLRFSERTRHKKAAELLRAYHEYRRSRDLVLYRRFEEWLALPPFDEKAFSALADRYHLHLKFAEIAWKEHNLLKPAAPQTDRLSDVPLALYLDNLRSAFNAGSILRTVEAFRLGKVCFAKSTPTPDTPKVRKTTKETHDKIPWCYEPDLSTLPRPFIALEVTPEAPSIHSFAFPPSFTLILGSELRP